MQPAPMPKATIYKHRESRGTENKVSLAGHALIATPAVNAIGAKD